jgi:putative endonuclease
MVNCECVMGYYCYILKCADGTFYTGWTTDPQRRLKQHNTGQGARYTRSRRPVELVYVEDQLDKTSAMKREHIIKKLSHAQKWALITKD